MRGRTQGKREERENRPNGKMPRLPPVEPLADDALLVFIFPASAQSFLTPVIIEQLLPLPWARKQVISGFLAQGSAEAFLS